MNGTNNATDQDNTHSGEPVLTSPPIYERKHKCFIDCGTFIIYNYDGKQQYGRLLSNANNNAKINEYQPFETIVEEYNLNEPALRNPYMEVVELVQTTVIHQISPNCVSGIFFLFTKDEIVNGNFPCEGIEIAFVL